MKRKQTGLASFARGGGRRAAETASKVSKRPRGHSGTVTLTVRLSRGDWERLHQLAVSEGTSLQALAVKGFSTVFADKGLPGFEK